MNEIMQRIAQALGPKQPQANPYTSVPQGGGATSDFDAANMRNAMGASPQPQGATVFRPGIPVDSGDREMMRQPAPQGQPWPQTQPGARNAMAPQDRIDAGHGAFPIGNLRDPSGMLLSQGDPNGPPVMAQTNPPMQSIDPQQLSPEELQRLYQVMNTMGQQGR
jgi:hypothetical protein